MNPYFIEIAYALPPAGGATVGTVQRRGTQLSTIEVAEDGNGRALVLKYVSGAPSGAAQRLATFEAYDRVMARVATVSATTPTARMSDVDKTAATNNRQADLQATTTNPQTQG